MNGVTRVLRGMLFAPLRWMNFSPNLDLPFDDDNKTELEADPLLGSEFGQPCSSDNFAMLHNPHI